MCFSHISAYLLLDKEECSLSGRDELSEIKKIIRASRHVYRLVSD